MLPTTHDDHFHIHQCKDMSHQTLISAIVHPFGPCSLVGPGTCRGVHGIVAECCSCTVLHCCSFFNQGHLQSPLSFPMVLGSEYIHWGWGDHCRCAGGNDHCSGNLTNGGLWFYGSADHRGFVRWSAAGSGRNAILFRSWDLCRSHQSHQLLQLPGSSLLCLPPCAAVTVLWSKLWFYWFLAVLVLVNEVSVRCCHHVCACNSI